RSVQLCSPIVHPDYSLHSCLLCGLLPPPATLFPYTTLFRSHLSNQSSCLHFSSTCLPPMLAVNWRARRVQSEKLRKRAHFAGLRSEEHTSELQSRFDLVCRLLLEKKKQHPDEDEQEYRDREK